MHLMTRLAALAAVALSLALVACGDDESSSEPAASGGASSSAFPVTVEHKYGKTEIAREPERVVTVGYTDQDFTLSLGVVPVGVADYLGGYEWRKRPWAQEALKGAEPKVVAGQQINFEAVAAQRPDLILAVTAGLKKGDYDKLSRIAPTVAQSGDFIDFGMPWQDQTRLIGKALGRTEQAEKAIADLEAKFAQARKDHPEFEGKDAILAYGGPDGYGAYATADTRSRFLSDLGFKLPKEIDDLAKDAFFVEFSQEQFRLLDQDAVLMYGPQKAIEGNKVVRRLNAVKEDRIVYLDYTDQFAGAIGFASPLSLTWLLDEAVPKLAAAVDGRTDTPVEQPR